MNAEKVLSTVEFFVEANDNEYHWLWKEYHKEYQWEQIPEGFLLHIGTIGDPDENRQVYASVRFAKLKGRVICFYNATSRFVDHTMIEEYFKSRYPVKYDNGYRDAYTDGNNFHHVLGFVKE